MKKNNENNLKFNIADCLVLCIGLFGVWLGVFANYFYPLNPISTTILDLYGALNWFGGGFVALSISYFLMYKYYWVLEKWFQKWN